MFKHSVTRLKTGLTVIRVPMPAISSVTALVLGNTGSRYETPKQQGIAHFFEHMVFKGTKNYPTPQVIASEIDALGAEFNAFTSKEYTGYYVKSASEHLEKSLDVLSDMLLQPNLKQEDIDREKGVIIEELNMYHDTPMRYVGNLFDRVMFEGSGLEHDIIGSKETILSFKRADFQTFLDEWYGLGNLVLVLAGDARLVEDDQTLALVERLFAKNGKSRSGKLVDSKLWLSQNETKTLGKEAVGSTDSKQTSVLGQNYLSVDTRTTEQVHLSLGWPGLTQDDERRFVLSLLGVIVGGNMSSRLFSEVREKRGLCYYVRSDIDRYHDTGVFGAGAGVDPKRLDEALTVIIDEFNQLALGKKPITADELKRAQDYTIGSLILSLEDSQNVAQFFGLKQILSRKVTPPGEAIKKLRAVTVGQVQALASDLVVDDEMRLAVIGPVEKNKVNKFVGKV